MRLEVTRRAGLAVQAVTALAPVGRRVKAAELAATLDTSAGFVPQIVGPLIKAGWMRSVPGPTGGYVLTEAVAELSVLDIVEAVDGPTDTGMCVIEGHLCGSAGAMCAVHAAWLGAREMLTRQLALSPAVPGGSLPPGIPATRNESKASRKETTS